MTDPAVDGIPALLEAVAAASPIECARIAGARRMPAGSSRETWLLERPDAPPLVLRLNTPGSIDGEALLREAACMRAASAAGVPSPVVLASGTGLGPLRHGFVLMSHVDGESVPQRILRDPSYADIRDRFANEAGRILARLHGVAVEPLAAAGLPGGDQLDAWSAELARDPDPHPILDFVESWLRRHRPAEPSLPRLVHGDFRLGNLLLDTSDVRAVLDWELAHLGDPVEDLAWLTVRAWRFGRAPEVAGCGRVDDLVGAYEDAGGDPVDPDRLRWWQVMGCYRWGVICRHQVGRHLSGSERSVELAAIGRRVAEAEHDAMLLLA